MRASAYLLTAMFVAAVLVSVSSAGPVGFALIRAPAVIIYNNTGSLTTITLTITNGNGTVNFVNASQIANDTHFSAYTAARYASQYTGKNFSKYDFTYSIEDGGSNVSGPSAGAAMTLLAISAFRNTPLRTSFTITGTISPGGSIGEIGGAIDKISAASGGGLTLMLVPWVPQGNIEQGIYYVGQEEYGIPVVEVSNISQAASYAFGNSSGVPNEVTVNFTSQYNVNGLPAAPLNCSNGCDQAPFSALANYTIATTRSQIANISGFGAGLVGRQLANVTNQATQIGDKGYLYVSADVAFLSYLDAFYISSYNMTRAEASSYMQGVQTGCSGLLAPQLTSDNYEYVIAAELRQGWANYTINSTISGFNTTGATRDDIVSAMYSVGQAQAWCGAVSTLYSYPYSASSAPVTFSQSLGHLAIERINRASQYPGMYLTLAQAAYKAGNYPVAILDADYAYALSSSAQSAGSANVSALNTAAIAVANNSTYGAWATQFSNEALFYVYESSTASNSTVAGFYADEAYASAKLASQLSADTQSIYASLISGSSTSSTVSTAQNQNGNYGAATVSMLNTLTAKVHELTLLVALTLALLAGCIVLVAILAHKVLVLSAKPERKGRRRK